eukprot:Hpha_TRINITY_DN27085_c0_g1::TRINITY_DN27085_c0_g1_i1::g.33340::m.33340
MSLLRVGLLLWLGGVAALIRYETWTIGQGGCDDGAFGKGEPEWDLFYKLGSDVDGWLCTSPCARRSTQVGGYSRTASGDCSNFSSVSDRATVLHLYVNGEENDNNVMCDNFNGLGNKDDCIVSKMCYFQVSQISWQRDNTATLECRGYGYASTAQYAYIKAVIKYYTE